MSCSVDQLEENGYKVVSAGVMAPVGAPPTPEAVEACRQERVDISGHRAQQLTREMLDDAALVLVMDGSHHRAVLRLNPQVADRVLPLDADAEITDPLGLSLEHYQKYSEQISRCVKQRLDEFF